MNATKMRNVVYTAFQLFRGNVPKDTGNMRYNATKLEHLGANEWRIVVDASIAPYAVYTNEKWISPRWNGKTNPNEGWVGKAFDLVSQMIFGQIGFSMRRR